MLCYAVLSASFPCFLPPLLAGEAGLTPFAGSGTEVVRMCLMLHELSQKGKLLCCAPDKRHFDSCALYTRSLWALSCSKLRACVCERRSQVQTLAPPPQVVYQEVFCCLLAGWLLAVCPPADSGL